MGRTIARIVALTASTLLAVSVAPAAPSVAQTSEDVPPGATAPVAAPTNLVRPSIEGTARYGKRLTGRTGSWSPSAERYEYRWLRDGRLIGGADERRYTIRPADVGHRLSLRVTALTAGAAPVEAVSRPRRAQHVRDVREVVTYSVRTRGSVRASVSTFERQAQETYDDPRGWRAMGVRFKRVRSGGEFTLWLSQASRVPSFSSACSATYSCRVGRNVVINETRWRQATPAWDANRGTLRDYRHMVVNHETGHWFGRGHASCGKKGSLAPVMQQQSKGLGGCRINPWPKKNELHTQRFGF